MGEPLAKRPLDLFFFIFFLVHIPTTLLCDAQAIYPSFLQNETLLSNVEYYTFLTGDHLMKSALPNSQNLIWFKSIIFMELFLQVPYFCFALKGLWFDQLGQDLHRVLALAYSSHVMTTVVPLLGEFWFRKQLTLVQRGGLIGVYGIFFVVPLMYFFRALFATRSVGTASSRKMKKN